MSSVAGVRGVERGRFLLLALLLLVNSIVLESNEVVGTSGFISRVGVSQILLVWAADMSIVVVTSGVYSLVIDRVKRQRLALGLFAGFGVFYLVLFGIFMVGAPDWVSYSLLMVVTDQQWLLFPLVIWALANDMFSVAEAKRLFPLLGAAALGGRLLGNGLAAGEARFLGDQAGANVRLLPFNGVLILLAAVVLLVVLPRLKVAARQSRQGERVLDTLREGLAFVREVPSYRYLTLAMILLGMGFNAIEFAFLAGVVEGYPDPAALQTFYGVFKVVSVVGLMVVQGLIAGWLLRRVGFKHIFGFMPVALLVGLVLSIAWPAVLGVVIGDFLARVTLFGIDEPSRRAFQGMVPDERRGRVSAFMDGYLYPLGSVLGCVMVGTVVVLIGRSVLAPAVGRVIYLGLGALCTVVALWAVSRFRVYYDASMLNWRLRRRQRKSVLEGIEF